MLKEDSPELAMYCMLHNLGETYGMLPSQVISNANTFDLVVFDAVMSYKRYVEEKDRTGAEPRARPGTDHMAAALKKMRGEE